jgi:hypothetical protein
VVRADANTIFDGFASVPPGEVLPSDLDQGSCIEVSGFRESTLSTSDILATRVQLESSGCPGVQLTGTVNDVSGLPNTIEVSGTVVDISALAITPAQGDLVVVDGSFDALSGVLTATQLIIVDRNLSEFEDDDVDVEGIIDDCSTGCGSDPNVTFSVSGIPVSTNSGTTYENGNFTNLRNDIRVEVEGTFSSGVLVADEVEFKLGGDVELEAIVAGPPAAGVVTVGFGADTLTVLTDPLITQFKDETGSVPSVDDLEFGDYVKITGYVDSTVSTDAVATKLELEERTSSDANRVLQGPVDSISDPNIVILGIEVNTSSLVDADFEPFGRTNFFSQVGPDDIVKAQGTDLGGAMFWEEVELEED